MNLDDREQFRSLDVEDMYGHIGSLPDQLQKAWELGKRFELPEMQGVQNIVIAGMGGSAIGGDLVTAFIEAQSSLPVIVHRDYGLPGWAHGDKTLVIASSHSGNTEETLDSFKTAQQRGCRILAVCTGGELAQNAAAAGIPVWQFDHRGQPRAAVGFSFGLLLALFHRLGVVPDPSAELGEAISAMRRQQQSLAAEVAVIANPAKRMAGQLIDRWIVVIGAGYLAPVARRWKGQVSEIAKAWGQFEFLPEADHNTLAGLVNPADLFPRMMALFLRAPAFHPRNRLRLDLTRKGFMVEGLNTDFYEAQGEGVLAHIWTALHFGDYLAYYLAMAYGVDPTPVTALENLKAEMKTAGGLG